MEERQAAVPPSGHTRLINQHLREGGQGGKHKVSVVREEREGLAKGTDRKVGDMDWVEWRKKDKQPLSLLSITRLINQKMRALLLCLGVNPSFDVYPVTICLTCTIITSTPPPTSPCKPGCQHLQN